MLPAVLYHGQIFIPIDYFFLLLEVRRLGEAVALTGFFQGVGIGIEAVEVEQQNVFVELLGSFDEVHEVDRACDFHGVPKENVVSVGVIGLYDAPEAGVAWYDCEDAHGLLPAVPKNVLSGEKDLATEPLVQHSVE